MRNIIITIILLVLAALMSVMYFRKLNSPGQRPGKVMENIPSNAALIFEYKNDETFYDIFSNNKLLSNLIGDEHIAELTVLKTRLLDNNLLKNLFEGQSLFISVHPQKDTTANLDFLITTSTRVNMGDEIDQLARQKNSDILIHPMQLAGKKGYNVFFNSIKRRFYLLLNDDNTFSASFSQPLVEQAAKYHNENHEKFFVQLSDQQNSNSIANLYVNYSQLVPLFDELFKNKNTDIFRSFRLLYAIGAFSLNYRSDALMFNGISHINNNGPKSYLDIFRYQQPVVNKLKSIFPASLAYSLNFAVSNPVSFETDLLQWQLEAGYNKEKDAIFKRIKTETSINLAAEFAARLGNEFAIVTTRYQEKIGLIQLKNGLNLRPFMVNISKMTNDDMGQFNYDKLPFYLLGDSFSIFRRPYFMIVDNYLIICNSQSGMNEYYKNYTQGNFLAKTSEYVRFDNLQAERSNVSFFINFKNAHDILTEALKPRYARAFAEKGKSWSSYYAAGYQFTASEKDFYTNFYMRLNLPDTAAVETTQ
ncbi:hypothetical protein BDD43_5226 [Mucilaginibacter gracilis]|uniref:DUF3352 domain-containing protein n=1 Tax=Mucilaginibacter gracilis TaxID=423350 RepID=A0A495J9B2_9SPHI|nr:hypothetical protein [Mucilaginibacter gracilis]RKR84972.1 hypothetical protein BDD43_5226 [Mucilaginibacter gracilis]